MSPAIRKRQYIPQHTYRGRLQRDDRFDNVRGVLIILVVIGHFLFPLYQTRLVTGIIYAIYVFHMPCFVMVSGYYAKSIYKDGYFRWGKIVQMLWLYILYECVVWVTEGLGYGGMEPYPNFFKESGAPWYLLCMVYFYMTLPLFNMIEEQRARLAVVVVLILAASFGKYLAQTGSWFCMDRAISFLPFFYIGYYNTKATMDRYLLSPYKRNIDIAAGILVAIVFFLAYDVLLRYNLVVFGTSYNRYIAEDYSKIWLFNLIWYAVAFIISLGFIGSMLNRRMLIITALGRNTLQIYFLHRPIRDIMMYFGFYDWFNPHSKINVMLLIVFCVLLTIFLGNSFFGRMFSYIRSVFDPLLEKVGAL